MRKALQIAVAGSGIGTEHVKAFAELPRRFKVNLICDTNFERARHLAEEYGVPEVTESFDEVCRRQDIDVIDICTPPNLHLEQIQSALKAGKHVICEKPLVESLSALDSLADLARSSGRQVMPIFQYRFGHGLQKLKDLVQQELTGEAFVF
jgi:predicted dehydrogenase